MNRYLKISLLSLLVVFCCTGCNGTITRDIRHNGFAVSGTFECSYVFPKDKEDTSYEKIKYFTGSHLITNSGKIYEVSMNQTYASKENCKEADTQIKEKANLNSNVIKGEDNKYYYLFGQSEVAAYSEITPDNKDYQLYDLLLKDADVVKVITVDSNAGVYYTLKSDGNVYKIVVGNSGYNTPFVVNSVGIAYDKNDYGSSKIVDFYYGGEQSISTFIRTENRLYRVMVENKEECTKYADVSCKFKMKEDTVYEQYKDSIIAYNGSVLITNYKKTFTVGG